MERDCKVPAQAQPLKTRVRLAKLQFVGYHRPSELASLSIYIQSHLGPFVIFSFNPKLYAYILQKFYVCLLNPQLFDTAVSYTIFFMEKFWCYHYYLLILLTGTPWYSVWWAFFWNVFEHKMPHCSIESTLNIFYDHHFNNFIYTVIIYSFKFFVR